jgi:hypothetical protein
MKYFDDEGGMKVSSIDSLLSTLLRAAACTPRTLSKEDDVILLQHYKYTVGPGAT